MENFYVLYGPDRASIQFEFKQLIKKIEASDIIKYDMKSITIDEVIDDAITIGMFSKKKTIILEDAYFLGANKTIENIERLENYIEHSNPNTTCIFLSYMEKIDARKKINKLLNKHKVIEIKKKDTTDLKKYIETILKENKYTMENINYFLDKVGTNLSNIKNELDKLMMYKINDKIILKDDIDKICIFTSEEEIFALTDAIVAKDMLTSFKLLEEFLNKNYDEIQIIMILASQFRFFYQVKRLLNKGKSESEIAKTLSANPYRIKFTIKKLYTYSENILLNYIQRIAKMDHDIKLGLMDKKLALELFITTNR